MINEASLYIHIPFCVSKCDYCDFYSIPIFSRRGAEAQRKIKKFLDTLIQDIFDQIESLKIESIPTIYIGGGTPSVLAADMGILFDALKKLPAFTPQEFTIEANPESCTEDFLAVCKEGGVNRLSLGVQTFHEPSRLSVNRAGDAAAVEKALSLAAQYYPNNLSADLIIGFPYHTKDIIKDDIKRLLDYKPAHVSAYSLTLEPETPLYKKVKTEVVLLPGKDESDELWLTARDLLLNAGFKHYEVSNFAKEGKMCKHNIRYWRMESWLGAGPCASGTIIDEKTGTAERYTYDSNIEEYARGCAPSARHRFSRIKKEEIYKEELIREIILMGYRYYEGPDPKWGVEKLIPDTLQKWENKNIMLYLNSFLVDAFNELDNSRVNIQVRNIKPKHH